MMTKTVMTIAKAQVLADDMASNLAALAADLEIAAEDAEGLAADFLAAVAHALAEGWEVVEIDLTPDGGNVWIGPHTGVMVGWFLDDWLADSLRVDGGETDLHLTLAFLGDVADLTPEQTRTLTGIVAEVASQHPALYGRIEGTGTFENVDENGNPQTVWWARPELVGLDSLREALVSALADADLPVVEHGSGYTPHITLAYLDGHGDDAKVPEVTIEPLTIIVPEITVAIAGTRHTLSLADMDWDAFRAWEEENAPEGGWPQSAYRPLIKAVVEAEKRFTLGPWYIPGEVDAHGEWTDADTLQEAAWKYVRTGYRAIHLQHSPDIIAGEWVEIMTLPHATTWPVIDVSGEVVAHEYPAGTVMLGVIWQPWAWSLVKSGAISGYSIGGYSNRVDEDAPAPVETDDEGDDD